MQLIDRQRVQPGWEVWTSDGEQLGKVIQVERAALHVKSQGLLGRVVIVPTEAINEVEEGRVEVTLKKDEAALGR